MTNQHSGDDSPNIWLVIFFVFLSLCFCSCLFLLFKEYFGKKHGRDLDADRNYNEEQERFIEKKPEEDLDASVPFLQKANLNTDYENYSQGQPI